MKKVLLILSSLFVAFILTGCNTEKTTIQNSTNVNILESEIDYFVFRNKKIYLTKNLEEYVMQFQGMECKLNRNLDIDNIKSKEHGFYQLEEEIFNITCPNAEIKYPASSTIMVDSMNWDESGIKSVDREAYYWGIYGASSEGIDVYFEGEKITINGKNTSKKSDVIKVLGSNYEYEESISFSGHYDLIYEINSMEYKFSFDEDDELNSLYIVE